ncbi:ABC transporter substrate-binding protein [Microbacterium marinum]|uniref:ABC transporter substrate-binding protein n=1 Tax=Microbacterium marinum TaxID=421115 RepID=UPI00384E5D1A
MNTTRPAHPTGMPRNARRLAIAATAAAALFLTGCAGADSGSSDAAEDGGLVPVSMGIQPWIGYGQWYVAEDQGVFDEHGLDVSMVQLNTDADKISAFASGQVNATNLATHTAMMLQEAGVDLKIVVIQDYSETADAMIAGPGVTSIDELAGKSIAYEQGATSDLLLHAALDDAGLTMDDITPVPMAASDAAAALISGQVDVAITYEPYITTALEEDPTLTPIYDGSDAPGLISDALAVTDELIEQSPETVQALVDSWGEAVDYYNSDTDAARTIMAEAAGEDPEALASAFDGVLYFDKAQNAEAFSGEYVSDVLPLAERVATEAGLLTKAVDLESLYDSQFAAN